MRFLEDTLTKLADEKIGLFRADSRFYDKEILNYLEIGRLKPIDCIIPPKYYLPIKRALSYQQRWFKLADHGKAGNR